MNAKVLVKLNFMILFLVLVIYGIGFFKKTNLEPFLIEAGILPVPKVTISTNSANAGRRARPVRKSDLESLKNGQSKDNHVDKKGLEP